MTIINELFKGWAAKMPWGSGWLQGSVQIGPIDLNRFFIIIAAAVLALIIILVSIIIAAAVKHKKKGGKPNKKHKAEVVDNTIPKAEPKQNDELIVVEAKHEELKVERKAADAVQDQPAEEPIQEEEQSEAHEQVVEVKDEPQESANEVHVIEDDQPAEEPAPQEEAPAVEESLDSEEDSSLEMTKDEDAEASNEEIICPPEQSEPQDEAESKEQPKEEEVAAAEVEDVKEEPKADINQDDEWDFLDVDVPAKEEPKAEEPAPQEEPKEEPKPEAKPKAEPKAKKAPVAAAAVKTNTNEKERTMEKKVLGTFEISLCIDGYRFRLYANNKQLLFESTGFTSVDGALKGIETFRKTVADSSCFVTKDKFGRFRYIFNKRYQGENYTTAKSAASAAESVKRFAPDAKLNVIDPSQDELKAYTDRKKNQRTRDDVDWDKVAKEEANAKPMGKLFVDEEVADEEVIGFRYFLVANNGQILYTSAIYASAKSARDGIDAFKRAVYIGNFYIDEDKFGHFRYILRGEGNSTYVGESYTSKASAENAKKSVEKFVVCAPIVTA